MVAAVDAGDPGTGDDLGTETDDSGDLPDVQPQECGAVAVAGPPGVGLEIGTESLWESGTCLTFTVRNESSEDVFWWQVVRMGGELDSHWNAATKAVETRTWEFRGVEEASNVALLRGESTVFGACLVCNPQP